jgi:hypothetical protein
MKATTVTYEELLSAMGTPENAPIFQMTARRLGLIKVNKETELEERIEALEFTLNKLDLFIRGTRSTR